ncbi:hypothetical protein [Shimia thalassica]|uniref:hypothetical protein n=1 Tax=Shimia thalassica TaxID=1715693 RepID=UPI0026E21C71|nr:hypothetical protein [Shimia thalassica]MDO6481937.1 hypothetical protein [Shimia thalassica]
MPESGEGDGTTGGAGHDEGEGGAGTDGKGAGEGEGSGGSGSQTGGKPANLERVRNRISESNKRVVYFTPSETGLIELSLSATGVFGGDQLQIVRTDSSAAKVLENGNVQISVSKGDRTSFEVQTVRNYDGPVEIAAKLWVEQ